jgi:hypothetical protein
MGFGSDFVDFWKRNYTFAVEDRTVFLNIKVREDEQKTQLAAHAVCAAGY